MWTNENRGRYNRSRLRYPSDLTDDEWNLVEPLIPPGKRGGDKRTVIMREVVNGLMYILSTGCQWRAIPKDLPPRSTLYDYFDLWSWDGTLDLIHHELYVKCREAVSREASPTAAVIDSQSVKSAEKGGPCIDPPGFDAGKLIKGKKRHILVDTQGLLLHAIVHPADIQDRDGGILLLSTLFGLFPFLKGSLPTAPMRGLSSMRRWPRSERNSKPKSSGVPIGPKASSFCRADGSSSAPLRGSIVAAGLPRTGKISTSAA